MASYQKRGKTWQYAVSRMVNGKSDPIRKGGFKTKKEAQVAAAEVEGQLRKGLTPILKPMPFDEYFESWLNTYKPEIAKNTRARYENTLKTIKEFFGGVPIQDITKRTYQEALNKYGQGRAKDTTRKLNTHVRACVKDAIDEGLITVDFTRAAKMSGTVESKKPEEKHLNYFDSKRLLKKLHEAESLTHYLLLLALTSGMRFAELVGLTRPDFDFKKSTIKVTKTWGYTNKMQKGFGPTKNPQSVRTIKMDKPTMDLFENLFKRVPENIHKLVFYSPQSKYKVISNNAANKSLERLLNDLRIDSISVHGLRHTHASILLYKGISIYYVSERLGHGDIETTMAYYAHIIKELREKDEKGTTDAFNDMAV